MRYKQVKHRTVIFIVALICLVTGCIFSACNPIAKATQRVLANEPAFNKVGGEFVRLHPCVNDTAPPQQLAPVIVKGKDSSYPEYVLSTIYKSKLIDTIINGAHIRIDSLGNIFFKQKVCVPDTVLQPSISYVADKRALQMAQDSLAAAKLAFANYKAASAAQAALLQQQADAKIKAANDDADAWKSKARHRMLYLVAVIAAALMWIFKKPLFSLITGGVPYLNKP